MKEMIFLYLRSVLSAGSQNASNHICDCAPWLRIVFPSTEKQLRLACETQHPGHQVQDLRGLPPLKVCDEQLDHYAAIHHGAAVVVQHADALCALLHYPHQIKKSKSNTKMRNIYYAAAALFVNPLLGQVSFSFLRLQWTGNALA